MYKFSWGWNHPSLEKQKFMRHGPACFSPRRINGESVVGFHGCWTRLSRDGWTSKGSEFSFSSYKHSNVYWYIQIIWYSGNLQKALERICYISIPRAIYMVIMSAHLGTNGSQTDWAPLESVVMRCKTNATLSDWGLKVMGFRATLIAHAFLIAVIHWKGQVYHRLYAFTGSGLSTCLENYCLDQHASLMLRMAQFGWQFPTQGK